METESLHTLIKRRTSCRSYLPDPIPDKILDQCLDAVRWAPSACNKQPWRIIAVRDAETRAEICQRALLPGIPMPWLATAPVIVALCVKKSFLTHTVAPMVSGINYQLIDAGIA
ncbi:MAG: nitroreductase family protein, partial [Victivallaceae bacterium]